MRTTATAWQFIEIQIDYNDKIDAISGKLPWSCCECRFRHSQTTKACFVGLPRSAKGKVPVDIEQSCTEWMWTYVNSSLCGIETFWMQKYTEQCRRCIYCITVLWTFKIFTFLDPYTSTTLVLSCSLPCQNGTRLALAQLDLFALGWIYPQIDIEGRLADV